MKRACCLLLCAAWLVTLGYGQRAPNPFLGRWDITVTPATGAAYPDWMEVSTKDTKMVAQIQPRSGGAFWAADVAVDGSRLTVKTNQDVTWEMDLQGGKLIGAIKRGGAEQGKLAGVRAPALNRPMPKAWSDPEPLFNGKDLTGWEPIGTRPNHWVARDGELVNEASGANLKTTRKFDDFKLHVEFNCPDKGNSGIYLRGRYEVQVEYEPIDANDKLHSIGSIYSFVGPAVDLPRKPGTWESFDITFVGRHVTIVRNGVKTIDNQEIPGITGGALDSNEGEPGPFYIQGDHTGGMRYRNLTIQVAK